MGKLPTLSGKDVLKIFSLFGFHYVFAARQSRQAAQDLANRDAPDAHNRVA